MEPFISAFYLGWSQAQMLSDLATERLLYPSEIHVLASSGFYVNTGFLSLVCLYFPMIWKN
jgi:hypothetical protein